MAEPYHPYVFQDGRFVGDFESMYRSGERDSFDPWHQDDVENAWILELLEGQRADQLLDLGCGKGALTAKVAQQVGALLTRGIDCSPTAIRAAKERYPSLQFHVGDVMRAVDRWGYQDLVIASEILSYVPNWRELVGKALRSAAVVCISLYLPSDPIGYVKSFDDLITAVETHGGTIEKRIGSQQDRIALLVRSSFPRTSGV